MTRIHRLLAIPALATVIAATSPALAHKPSYGDSDAFGSPEAAYIVEDLDVSIVLYHEVTCSSEVLWMEYDAETDGAELYVQLGVPVIPRLADYRPSLAVLAPGFPAPPDDLPFAVPPGYGAMVIDTNDVSDPTIFDEPFSQTESWVMHEDTLPVPAGNGYVVAWHPARQTGKLWVAIGTVEEFGPEDFAQFGDWMTATKTFHEEDGYTPFEEPVERICEPAELDLPAQTERAVASCSALPGTPRRRLVVMLLATLLVGRFRRVRRTQT